MYRWTVAPEDAPEQPTYLEIAFERGDPVALDGKPLSPAALLARLNQLAGANGIGRIDLVENRFVGMKSRGVYETPGGTVLLAAHRAIDRSPSIAAHLKDELMPRYAELIYNGLWFSPEREMLQALIDRSQAHVTGLVRLKLYKGNVQVVGRQAPHSLYDNALATFEADTVYDQRDAEGFIKLNALRLRVLARARATTTPAGDPRTVTVAPPRVEFFYGLGSRYSYLAMTRIALESETGCRVRWRPLFSGDLFAARGRDPFAGAPASGQYDWGTVGAMRSAGRRTTGCRIASPTAFSSTRAASRSPAPPPPGSAPWKHSADLFRALFVDGTSPLDDDVCVRWRRTRVDPGEFRRAIEQPETAADLAATVEQASARRFRRAQLRAWRRGLLRQRPAGVAAPRPAQDPRA